MKYHLDKFCLLGFALFSINSLYAQHPAKQAPDEITILLGDQGAEKEVINVFIQNAPKAYQSPDVPSFALVGKDKKFYLGVGGYAKTTLSYDFGNPITSGTNFTTSAIPMHPTQGNGGLVQLSAATSNVFANFVALPGNDNQLGIYISGNFLGPNYSLELQFAYLNYRGFTIGYNYGLMTDLGAAAPTIDYENAPGLTIVPNAVIDYAHSFNSRWSIGAGVEMPIASATTNASTYMVNQRIPDIPAYVQYSWNKGTNWLRLTGMMRNMEYRDITANKNRTNTGWGVKLSGTASAGSKLTAYYQAAYGQGMSSYFQDIYSGGLDMVPDQQVSGKLKNVEAWGGYLGLQYNFTPTTFMSCTYSHLRDYASAYSAGTTEFADQYKYGQYLVSNLFWNMTSRIQMGVEYLYGRRINMDDTSRHDNRIQTMIKFNF